MPVTGLDATGLAILVAYLLLTVVIGLLLAARRRTPESYFLADRSSGWIAIGLSMFASNISSTTLVGLAGAAYAIGISVYNYEWMAGVVLVVFILFLLPVILESRVYSLAEFLRRRYDRFAGSYCAVLTIGLNIAVDAAGTLYAGASVFRLILPDWELWQIAAVLGGCAALYTLLGGLRAVIATEVVQAAVMLAASAALAWVSISAAGGWDAIVARVPADKLSLIRPADDPGVPWPGLVLGIPLLGFYFWCANQTMVQRILSARTLEDGRRGALLVGFLKLPLLLLMVLPGSAALLLYPGLEPADRVFPTLVLDLLPGWLAGIVLAALAGAVLSVSASVFNSVSTLATMDLLRAHHPHWDDRRLVTVGRWIVAATALAAIAWVPVIAAADGGLWQYLQSALAYAVPPVVALFAGGVFLPRVNARGAHAAIVCGVIAGALLLVQITLRQQWPLHFLLAAPIVFAVSLAALWIGSITAPAPSRHAIEGLSWNRRQWQSDVLRRGPDRGWNDYRTLAAALLATTAMVVWTFR